MFLSGKGADNTAIIGIAVGVVVPCITVLLIVIAILFYCYKVKNRYRTFDEFRKDYLARFQIATSYNRNCCVWNLSILQVSSWWRSIVVKTAGSAGVLSLALWHLVQRKFTNDNRKATIDKSHLRTGQLKSDK